jgi:hypothetical protein
MASCRPESALCIATLVLGGLGCGDEAAPVATPSATYVGTVDGTGARIAVVHAGASYVAYVCGEGETLASHTRWFRGELDYDAGSVALVSDGWQLAMIEGEAHLRGDLIAPDGAVARWNAVRIASAERSALGLYDSSELGCRAGVIVWQDDPCSAQGAWCDAEGEIGQITPADCPAGGTLQVEALRDGGESFELTVERIEGPY